MDREEAIEIIRKNMPSDKSLPVYEALQTLVPELAESDDERIRKEMIRYFTEIKKGGSAALPYDDCIAYLERQKETGIRWFKSDDVKNPDKPYIDKAGMFYTTDGRMCLASEIEKQKEQKLVEINEYEIIKKHITEDVLSSEVNKRLKECGWYVTENPSQWSKEDEENFEWFDKFFRAESVVAGGKDIPQDKYFWFKSLRPQPKQEWSDKDEHILNNIYDFVAENTIDINRAPCAKECLDWLKSLRPPLKDKEMKLKILKYLSTRCSSLEFKEVEDYLNNLRPSWKPSNGQMTALKLSFEDVFNDAGYCNRFADLKSLYEQLKKLI